MKDILFSILFFLAWTIACSAQSIVLIAGGTPVAAPAYVVNQTFEGTGYDNGETWTEGGTPNEDYTTTVLEGSQSWRSVASSNYAWTAVSDAAVLELYFRIRSPWIGAGNGQVASFKDSGDANLISVQINNSGQMALVTEGAVGTFTTQGMPNDSGITHVWMRYEAAGTATLGWSTDGIRPTSGTDYYTTKAIGDKTIARLRIGHSSGISSNMIIDKVLVLPNGTIGNNP